MAYWLYTSRQYYSRIWKVIVQTLCQSHAIIIICLQLTLVCWSCLHSMWLCATRPSTSHSNRAARIQTLLCVIASSIGVSRSAGFIVRVYLTTHYTAAWRLHWSWQQCAVRVGHCISLTASHYHHSEQGSTPPTWHYTRTCISCTRVYIVQLSRPLHCLGNVS